MSLLQIIQDAADDLGINRPGSVIGSTDQQVRQLLSLANREGRLLAKRHPWQALKTEALVTVTSTITQGSMSTLATGFDYIIPETVWNRTQNRGVRPLSAQQWQLEKSAVVTGPYEEFRIRGNVLLMIPAPTSGDVVAFEYISKNWTTDSNGANPSDRWNADTDLTILDEELILLGIKWRWLKAKNLDYAEEFMEYERAVINAMSRDGGKDRLNIGMDRDFVPGIQIEDGNFGI